MNGHRARGAPCALRQAASRRRLRGWPRPPRSPCAASACLKRRRRVLLGLGSAHPESVAPDPRAARAESKGPLRPRMLGLRSGRGPRSEPRHLLSPAATAAHPRSRRHILPRASPPSLLFSSSADARAKFRLDARRSAVRRATGWAIGRSVGSTCRLLPTTCRLLGPQRPGVRPVTPHRVARPTLPMMSVFSVWMRASSVPSTQPPPVLKCASDFTSTFE